MDVVFFLKDYPSQKVHDLPWPGPVKLVGLDPPQSLMCGGADPRCSTAYSNMWNWLGGKQGVMPTLIAKYAPGATRVAFLGFSAAHGFLNPLLNNDADRAMIDAVILMDASFGGGKSGYVKAVKDAAQGKMLLATPTAFTGGDDSWQVVWEQAQQELGMQAEPYPVQAPMAQPSGGSFRLGKSAFYLRYVDPNNPKSGELPHWEMGKATAPMLEGYLIPYWRGELGGSDIPWAAIAGVALAAGGLGAAYYIWSRR